MLERIIAMASNPGQIVIDPFGGAGTTFYAAEKLHRYWLGTEIGDTEPAVKRLTDLANGKIEEWESARGKKKAKIFLKSSHTSIFDRLDTVTMWCWINRKI